ncbi:FKBP12-interacting protein of 37 kDa-like protein [Drosera capensis]
MVDFVADFSGNQSAKMSGTKRGFSELDDDDSGVFGNKKANLKTEETTHGETTKIIVSLRERFEKYKEDVEKLKCTAGELRALQSRKLLHDPAIYEEFMRLKNKEIGYQASEGKKSHNAALRSQYLVLYKHAEALENDMQKSNEMIINLQEKLARRDAESTGSKHLSNRLAPTFLTWPNYVTINRHLYDVELSVCQRTNEAVQYEDA